MIAFKEGVNMNAILYTIAMWVLAQLLFVWFCARFAAVKRLDLKDYLELREYVVRSGLDSPANERPALASVGTPIPKHVPPAGVARA